MCEIWASFEFSENHQTFFFIEKRTSVASMHTFDSVWKLGHPMPRREQKKTSPKNGEDNERKKRPQSDWRELFIEILVISYRQ